MTNLPTDAIPESDWKAGDTDWKSKGVLKKFYQSEFKGSYIWDNDGLANYGYVYYPYNCYDGSKSCKVHLKLHGCGETVDGPWFGFNELYYGGWLPYAASNDIILVMPQAEWSLFNPFECFDTFNYDTWWDAKKYMTKNGTQMKALKAMLDRVTEPRSADVNYGSKNILELDDFNFFMFDAWRQFWAFPGAMGAALSMFTLVPFFMFLNLFA